MANFIAARLTQNNLEREVQGATMSYNGLIAPENALRNSATGKPTPAVTGKIGDVVIVGILPAEVSVFQIGIRMKEAFAGGTTIKVGVFADSGGTDHAFDIVDGCVVDKTDRTIVVPVPVSGNVNPDDTAYTGDNGRLMTGTGIPHYIGVTLQVTAVNVADPKGQLDIDFTYDKFSTNNGAYTGGV